MRASIGSAIILPNNVDGDDMVDGRDDGGGS